MLNILFLGSLSLKRKRVDGVTVKCNTLVEWLMSKKIKLNIIDTDNWIKESFNILLKLIKNIKDNDAIIICAADRGSYYALRLLKLLNINKPIYYFVAGGRLAENIKNNKYKKTVYDVCTKVYVESKDMYDNLISLGLDNSEILGNFRFISNEINVKKTNNPIKLIYFGRVIEEKGISDAIQVVKRVIDKGYNVTFDIFGQIENEYFDDISKFLNERIRYSGVLNDKKYDIINEFDILIFPTKYPGECLPGTLIEAYICGLAILASDWKYAKEYIEDNKVGYIFKYMDTEDFERKLIKLLSENKTIDKFKKASKVEGNKYNCDVVLSPFYENIYNLEKNNK